MDADSIRFCAISIVAFCSLSVMAFVVWAVWSTKELEEKINQFFASKIKGSDRGH